MDNNKLPGNGSHIKSWSDIDAMATEFLSLRMWQREFTPAQRITAFCVGTACLAAGVWCLVQVFNGKNKR